MCGRRGRLAHCPVRTGAALALWFAASISAAGAVEAVRVGTFDSPTFVTAAPGYPKLLYVVERAGRIRVLRNEATLTQPFLDISDIVRSGGEQGLLSMAFAPNFRQSRKFYVAFTNARGALEINEFRSVPGPPARARKASRRVILRVPHPGATNHNGGQLQFGPDGLLYISTGDGGNLQPPGEPARRLGNLRGKILRIDPRPRGARPYRVPPDNPFVGRTGKDEIFSYGLRNPWRFSFHGNRVLIADVGQLQREEVNVERLAGASGANFGWPQYEGDILFDDTRPGRHPPTFPHFVYDHGGGRCAVIGGYVAPPRVLPDLGGRYLYGDLCTGEIRSIALPPAAPDDQATGIVLPFISSFGRGAGGRIYVAQINGALWRLAP